MINVKYLSLRHFVIILPTFLYGSSFFGLKSQECSGIPTCNGKRPSLAEELENLANHNVSNTSVKSDCLGCDSCDHLSHDGKSHKRAYIYIKKRCISQNPDVLFFCLRMRMKNPCLFYPDGLDLRSPSPCSQMPGEGSSYGWVVLINTYGMS